MRCVGACVAHRQLGRVYLGTHGIGSSAAVPAHCKAGDLAGVHVQAWMLANCASSAYPETVQMVPTRLGVLNVVWYIPNACLVPRGIVRPTGGWTTFDNATSKVANVAIGNEHELDKHSLNRISKCQCRSFRKM